MPAKGQTLRPPHWKIIIRRWRNMMSRCYNPADPGYKKYSSRGIVVHADWHDKAAFYEYVMESIGAPDQTDRRMTLDRIDNDISYIPGNIRWASYLTQVRNKSDNVYVEYNGVSVLMRELCDSMGVAAPLFYDRVFRQGWDVDTALSLPPDRNRRIIERSAVNELSVSYRGETKLLKHWCRELNLQADLVRDRISRGWAIDAAFSAPKDKGKSGRDSAQTHLYKGINSTMREISEDCGVGIATIAYRMNKKKMSADQAASMPRYGTSNGSAQKNALLAASPAIQ